MPRASTPTPTSPTSSDGQPIASAPQLAAADAIASGRTASGASSMARPVTPVVGIETPTGSTVSVPTANRSAGQDPFTDLGRAR